MSLMSCHRVWLYIATHYLSQNAIEDAGIKKVF